MSFDAISPVVDVTVALGTEQPVWVLCCVSEGGESLAADQEQASACWLFSFLPFLLCLQHTGNRKFCFQFLSKENTIILSIYSNEIPLCLEELFLVLLTSRGQIKSELVLCSKKKRKKQKPYVFSCSQFLSMQEVRFVRGNKKAV